VSPDRGAPAHRAAFTGVPPGCTGGPYRPVIAGFPPPRGRPLEVSVSA